MSSTTYTPGTGGAPYGNLPANPQGSNYAQQSGYTTTETIHLAKAIKETIFDAAPEQYNALKLIYEKDFKDVNMDEHEYTETTFGRSSLEANVIVAAAVPAGPGTPATQTLTLTAASMSHVSADLIILYPDNTHAVIRQVGPGNTVIVESVTNGSLPAVAVGDVFAIMSTIVADGMDYFSNYERIDTITRYNYIQFFLRACRWNRIELQKYINSGTTDYLTKDKMHKIRQIRIDLFNAFFNGEKGEFRISNGNIAKAMGGVFPSMVAAGSMSSNPTLAGFQQAFETLCFKTNFKREGATRFVYGCDEMLHEISKIYKQPGLRYAPNDRVAMMGLKKIELGTQNLVLVPCELFRETSCFPADWQRRILVLDTDTIQPVKMKGIPQLNLDGKTLPKGTNGSREAYQDFYVEAQLGLEFSNPLGSFWMDIQ